MAELPIACTLTPEALRTRREGLLMDLVRRAGRREDLDFEGADAFDVQCTDYH